MSFYGLKIPVIADVPRNSAGELLSSWLREHLMNCLYSGMSTVVLALILLVATFGHITQGEEFLSDASVGISLKHQQQWGDFGLDTAAAKPGAKGSPLRIGERNVRAGTGASRQWRDRRRLGWPVQRIPRPDRSPMAGRKQGERGLSDRGRTVTFAFESQPMSDSDPARKCRSRCKAHASCD